MRNQKFISLILLIGLSISLNASHIIEVSNCTASGIYERGPDIDGCACYDRSDMGARIYYDFQDNFPSNDGYSFEIGMSCGDGNPAPFGSLICVQQNANTNCDGIDEVIIGCNNCTVSFLHNENIPTLSQWGIIALSMIMLIIGLVGLKQRKVIFG